MLSKLVIASTILIVTLVAADLPDIYKPLEDSRSTDEIGSIEDSIFENSQKEPSANKGLSKLGKRRGGQRKVHSMKKYFSYTQIDELLNEPDNEASAARKLQMPDESDFTDVDGLEAFKDLNLEFEDLSLSGEQELLHHRINSKYKKSLDSSNYIDNYGFKGFHTGKEGPKVKQHFYDYDEKPKAIIAQRRLKRTGKVQETEKSALDQGMHHEKVSNLAELDAFIEREGELNAINTGKLRRAFTLLTEEHKVPQLDDMLKAVEKMRGKPIHRSKVKNFEKQDDFSMEELFRLEREANKMAKKARPLKRKVKNLADAPNEVKDTKVETGYKMPDEQSLPPSVVKREADNYDEKQDNL